MRRLAPMVVIIISAAAAGCGNSVDKPSAMKVMTAAITTTAGADGQIVHATWTATAAQVDLTLTNPGGSGTAHVTGSASDVNGTITSNVDVTFDKWSDPLANLTLSGVLHEAGSFTTSPAAGNIKLDGAVVASGSVNATVDFALRGDYGPSGLDLNGNVGGNVIASSFSLSLH